MGVATKAPHDYMSREYTAKEAGYVFMYFSNESPTQVEFYVDDVAMTYTPTSVVQYNEYYPFGLQASTSWTREDSKNNFLYNEGAELNNTSGWYETFFRGYDPALGRFMQVDPLATIYASHTSYNYGLNNPVYYNDPSGANANDFDRNGDFIADFAQRRSAMIDAYNGWSSDGGGNAYGRSLLGVSAEDLNSAPDDYHESALEFLNSHSTMRVVSTAGFGQTGESSALLRRFIISEGSWNDQIQGISLMISFIPGIKFDNNGWENATVTNLEEALQVAQSYTSRGISISNLALMSHGNSTEIHFGTDNLSATKVSEAKKYEVYAKMFNTFKSLLGQVSTGGSVLLLACMAGNNLGDLLVDKLRCDINIYMNMELSHGYLKDGEPKYKLDDPLAYWENNWRDISMGVIYRNVQINSNGTISTLK